MPLSRALVLYITIVIVAGAAILASAFPEFRTIGTVHVAAWILVSLLAESLWLSTITGKAMESMASTVDLSLLVLLGYRPAVWIVAIAFALANVIFSRRTWYKALPWHSPQTAAGLWPVFFQDLTLPSFFPAAKEPASGASVLI